VPVLEDLASAVRARRAQNKVLYRLTPGAAQLATLLVSCPDRKGLVAAL
jgi:hypothetical protein